MVVRVLVLVLLAFAAIASSLSAAVAPLPVTTAQVASGLNSPVGVTYAPGDTSRVFVIEQHTTGGTGYVRIVTLATGAVSATPFLSEGSLLTGGEQGLLGIAFHPNYASNGFVYINCTKSGGGGGGHTEIVRYTASGTPTGATAVDPATRTVVLQFDQPESNHNGGWLGFGTDGFLYIAAGDGGGGGDAHGNPGNG